MGLRTAGLVATLAIGVVAAQGAASAETVRGTVILPSAVRAGPERAQSFWPRIENGILPIGPPLVSPTSEIVVVLEGATKTASWAGNVVVELSGADLSPRVIPILVGTTVEFKNVDRIPYVIHSPDNSSFFGKEETPPSRSRKIKFLAPGVYPVRTDEFPHMEGAVLVLQSNLFARVDEHGTWKIDNVPEGRYTLSLFFHGSYVYRQSLEVAKSPVDVPIKLPVPAPRRGE
jgi:plastocyanin